MTVVVYKDGKIATDSRSTSDDLLVTDKIVKAIKGPGVIGGSSGDAVECRVLNKWIRDGADLDNIPKGKAWGLVAYKGTRIPRVIRIEEGDYFDLDLSKGEFIAIGGGGEIATGALEVGATPEEAVSAAIKYITNCGGKVQVVTL